MPSALPPEEPDSPLRRAIVADRCFLQRSPPPLHVDLFSWPDDTFVHLIARVGPNLVVLALHNVSLGSRLVVWFLEAHPNIQELSLLRIGDLDIFEALTYRHRSARMLLPELERIYIALWPDILDIYKSEALVAMLESRRSLGDEADYMTELVHATLDIPRARLSVDARDRLKTYDAVHELFDDDPIESAASCLLKSFVTHSRRFLLLSPKRLLTPISDGVPQYVHIFIPIIYLLNTVQIESSLCVDKIMV
ncbi:hypothetical protein C8J57DRAFT_1248905 [Mycena rebaudengoi]|nr:hypothetical protein C8J57DRAFT_1248905 [Mycena rebaudengoi]